MRYRIRTLLIVLALGPPIIAGGYWSYRVYRRATMTQLERNLEDLSREMDRRREIE